LEYDIRDIRDDGLRVSRHLGPGEVHALLLPVGVEPVPDTGEADLDLTLRLVETTGMRGGVAVAVQGRISGRFAVPCARCLAPATVEVQEPDVLLTFLPPSAADPGREELKQEDLDTYVHDGKLIDLVPVVREQLVLAIPITPLCQEDCKGICTTCGADLNQSPCSCARAEASTSPWVEALAKLKDNEGT